MTSRLPIIDLRTLRDGSDPGAVAAALDSACRDLGFLILVGHGIGAELTAATFEQCRRFFDQPAAAKEEIAIARSTCHSGYAALQGETLNADAGGDLKESLDIGIDRPADHPEVVAGTPLHGPAQWPDLPGFRDTVLEYMAVSLETTHHVMSGMALGLGLDVDYFAPLYTDPICSLRMLHYPPAGGRGGAGQPGAGAHTDYGSVTLLATDGVPGLQVQTPDGAWIDVEPPEGALVVNLGDMIARWTNDQYVSTPHRVLSPSGHHRYSMPFFTAPNYRATVEALPTCVSPERPAVYPPISVGEYMLSRFDATHAYRQGAETNGM